MNINFNTTVDSNIDDLDAVIAQLESADGVSAEAGLFGGFAGKKAMWNEYGTSRGIPARPFLRNTLYENERKWSLDVGDKLSALLNGNGNVKSIGFTLGETMVRDIRRTIDAGHFAPLAKSTIARKGHSKPLIDTGDMYSSITHKEV